MRRRKRQLTLGEVIGLVSKIARNDRETGLVVADLIHRGLIRLPDSPRRTRFPRGSF
jgi:hypothetical protein